MLTVSDTAFAIASVRAREAELSEGERLFETLTRKFLLPPGPTQERGPSGFSRCPSSVTASVCAPDTSMTSCVTPSRTEHGSSCSWAQGSTLVPSVWRRSPSTTYRLYLRGEPPPRAAVAKLGIASK